MHVKNHVAMWSLWFLWFLCVEYSENRLYKPLCAFLVFVDLVWFLCGSFCGFWSRVVFVVWSARPIHLMWFYGSAVLPSMPSVACPLIDGLCGSVVLPLMLDADDCASTCSLWTAKKICSLTRFVLCSVSSPLEATFTNGENDHGKNVCESALAQCPNCLPSTLYP